MFVDNPSPFFRSVVSCPISKAHLDVEYRAPCGFNYSAGDFRVGLEFSSVWQKGQTAYEPYHYRWMESADFVSTDQEVRDVYEAIKMHGAVLDVGGGPGTVCHQANLDPATFICLDAIPCRWADLAKYENFRKHYKHCAEVCRAPAFAEFLPIASGSMDFVHMRSCLDHFSNPQLALKEAYRVLKPSGQVVIGLSLEGSYKRGVAGPLQKLKILVKKTDWAREAYERLFDHHMFHPTREAVRALLASTGFTVKQEVWQAAYHNVLYVSASRD